MWILAAATIAIDLAFAYCVFTSRPRVSREHVCALCPAVGIAYIFVAQYALRSGGACLGVAFYKNTIGARPAAPAHCWK